MKLLECINDSDYNPEHLKWIKEFPILNEIYLLKSKVMNGDGSVGYILEELNNPPMSNGYIPNFGAFRFKEIKDDINIEELLKETMHEDI